VKGDYVPEVECAICHNRYPQDEMVYADNSVLLVCKPCYRKSEEEATDDEADDRSH
jgi:ribosome-binding protein aMBF1 (putative translation factor)